MALSVLRRIDAGAYANLALPAALDRSGLTAVDRRLATELVYGTTRMRRACDWLVDRFLARAPDAETRAVLRLGAYQLVFMGTPAHAAVAETVAVAPGRTRGLVNAVLRRVASAGVPVAWPSDAVRLSYPDWIIGRLADDLGPAPATAALEAMNAAPDVTVRPDGYVQDRASQWVAAAVGAAGERVLDLCAAPGGKATAMGATARLVVAADVRPGRVGLVRDNAARLGTRNVVALAADGRRPPFRGGAFGRVLIDAPCSGLGVLRRRPDARWRVGPDDVPVLAMLQRDLLAAAAPLVEPAGLLLYSVCTLTAAETVEIDAWASTALASFEPVEQVVAAPWEAVGRGWRLLPQAAGTDGMYLLALRRVSP